EAARGCAASPRALPFLLRGLDQVEVGGSAGAEPGVHPVADDLRIGHDLVREPEERDIRELIEEVIADGARDLLPLLRVHGVRQHLVVLVYELVLVVVVRALAPVARADPLLGRPPRDDVRPDAALIVFFRKISRPLAPSRPSFSVPP